MRAILGKVAALDARTKTLTVSVVQRSGGRDRTKKFEVSWSRNTAFASKGKRKVQSSPEKIRPGMNVIVQLEGAGGRADVVWHEPVRSGVIALTATECKLLGGKVVTDYACPGEGGLKRCNTAGGTMCVTE